MQAQTRGRIARQCGTAKTQTPFHTDIPSKRPCLHARQRKAGLAKRHQALGARQTRYAGRKKEVITSQTDTALHRGLLCVFQRNRQFHPEIGDARNRSMGQRVAGPNTNR